MGLGERAAKNRKVLGKHIDHPAIHRAPAGDHAIARDLGFFHAKIGAAVLDEHVELFEGVLIKQKVNALAGRKFAAGMLGL